MKTKQTLLINTTAFHIPSTATYIWRYRTLETKTPWSTTMRSSMSHTFIPSL